jgi:hypothetical protein
LKKKDFI